MTVNYDIKIRHVGNDQAQVTAIDETGIVRPRFAHIQHVGSHDPELILYQPVEFSVVLEIIKWYRPDMIRNAHMGVQNAE